MGSIIGERILWGFSEAAENKNRLPLSLHRAFSREEQEINAFLILAAGAAAAERGRGQEREVSLA